MAEKREQPPDSGHDHTGKNELRIHQCEDKTSNFHKPIASQMASQIPPTSPKPVSISPLLNSLTGQNSYRVSDTEIAAALALIFDNRLSAVQCSSLLTVLHSTERDREPLTIAKCAEAMRAVAAQPDRKSLRQVLRSRGRKEGSYKGGLCDIVGTGGDGHSTFNISTTSSIIASSLLLLGKHGNRASSSSSGSADLLQAIRPTAPDIEAVTSATLPSIYEKTNYAFLFAPKFHPGMKHVSAIRRDLGFRTIFNILGPLISPVEGMIEARIVGVAQQDLGPIFAEALRLSGAKNAMVVCGAEDLDEISCAGITYCWRLVERPNPDFHGSPDADDDNYTTTDDERPPRTRVHIETFYLHPSDFGLASHPLSDIPSAKLPTENAQTLMKILRNEFPPGDPLLDFILINTAALFTISGICDAATSSMGDGDDGIVVLDQGPGQLRWKEGVRRAKWALRSGKALASLNEFIEVSCSLGKEIK